MADNLHPADGLFPALPDHALISFVGPDALAFAQAQFANDVTTLADGQWQWNAWLTPKGRVIALFALLRRDAQTLWAVLPDYPADPFVEALRRFVFRRKLKIDVRPDWAVCAVRNAPGQARGHASASEADGVVLDRSSADAPRAWCVQPLAATQPASEQDTQTWRADDVRAGLPRLDADQREQWTPQQLSLDRWQAFSVKKGCYPGQEIVARTHFLGKAKRGLWRLQADAPLASGGQVTDGTHELGEVVSVASDARGHWALAVMSLDLALEQAQVGEVPVQARPWPAQDTAPA